MKTRKLLSLVVMAFVLLLPSVSAQSELFSRMPKTGVGKQIVSIHSYSAQTKVGEGAANMLIEDKSTNDDKWCDASSSQPWAIFEFSNYYLVDKFVITDAQIRETSFANVPEYKLYVTNEPYDEVIGGWEDSDWTEVYYGQNEGDIITKTIQLSAPVEARYVKFHILNKGTRSNGNAENACRIYGFDIYGSYSRDIDRGELISVGKTILKTEEGISKRETAINMLDGNLRNPNSKWCFGGFGQTKNYRYAIIDLENMYDINRFKVYDASSAEANQLNLDGVNIYVSRVAPNLGLINMFDPDPNTTWTKVVDSEMETALEIKEYVPGTAIWDAPVTARFVKLEIPAYKAAGADPNATSRIFQFEVYGNETVVPDNDATLSLLTVSTGAMSPDFAAETTEYTVNVVKEVESIVISASSTHREAVVTGAGTKELAIGANTFEIKVTSKDGSASKTYTVTVNRDAQSGIATLKSLKSSVGFFSPAFIADSTKYFVDVPFGTQELTLEGELTQADAVVDGLGVKTLTGGQDVFNITVTSENGAKTKTYVVTVVPEGENLISVNYGSPVGKRIVNIHSYSGKASDNENAYKLFLGERLNTNGNTANKWCDNSNQQPWVIMSLADFYEIHRIVIRDGRLVESANSNVANVGYYWVGVSTTGTNDEDFVEIASDWPDGSANVLDLDNLQDEARYIKFIFGRGIRQDGNVAGAVWLYGIDIYGVKTADVDRGEVISVGKTIVSRSSNYSDRETPCNLLDGNISYEMEDINTGEIKRINHDPWAFNRSNGDAWVIIDLEQVCRVDSFKLYDTNDWLNGYEVLVNNTGNEADWTKVFSQIYEPELEEYVDANFEPQVRTVGPDPKVGKLESPVNARFVKVSFPLEMQSPGWNRVREFEIFGSLATGLDDVKSGAASMVVYPNPVKKGNEMYVNEQGNLKIYSLQGTVVLERELSGAANISTAHLTEGSYIIRLSNSNGVKQSKLIVK